jgi:hypothetical protein
MKSRNFIATLLALTIRVMVSGQNQSAASPERVLPVLGVKEVSASLTKKQSQNEKTEKAQKVISESSVTKPKVYPTVVSSDTPEKANTVTSAEKVQTATPGANNTVNFYNNGNIYSTKQYADQLLKESEELILVEGTLRAQARTKQGAEKAALLRSANGLLSQAELKQIQASEISGKISLDKFRQNDLVINKLFCITAATRKTVEQAGDFNSDARYQIRLATELREEAYAMPTNAAKLGTMINAEEKEFLALGKQEAVMALLRSTAAVYAMTGFDLCLR